MRFYFHPSRIYALRALIPIVFLSLLLATCSEGSPTEPTTGQQSRVLAVPMVAQQTPVWCWAAVSEMVFRYYGRGLTQCQVLSGWYRADCCTFFNACQTTASLPVIQQTLSAFGIGSRYAPSALSFAEVAAEIDAGRPIIAAYRGSSAGHVVVIFGYEADGRIHIRDPLFGTFVVPYAASFTYGGQMFWAETIYRIG